MANSDILGLREMSGTMNQRSAVLNEWLAILESAAGHVPAIEVDTNTPPGTPANGNVYITGASPTGDWSGEANSIARYYNDAWLFAPIREGLTAYDATANTFEVWDGAAWSSISGGGAVSDGDKGDITVTGSGATWTIDNGVVSNAKLADMADQRIKGNVSGSTAAPSNLTAAQVKTMLAIANTDVSGLGTASVKNTGTSGNNVPLLNAANTHAAGNVFTDDLSISGAASATFVISGAAGSLREIQYQTGGSLRWRVGTQTAAESGANAGTGYSIRGYDDSGVLIGTAMQITRATLNTNLFSLTLDTALAVAQGGTGATSAASARTNLGAGDASGPASSTDNAAARFDGTTGKLLQNSDLIINDDKSITLSSVASDPSAPAADKLVVFSRTLVGRAVPAFRSATEGPFPLQRALGRGRYANHLCAFGQTAPQFNGIIGPTAVGTATSASFASTNRFTQEQRIEYLVTVASTSAVAGYRTGSGINIYHRGANAGQGGYHYSTRWGPATGVSTSTTRAFVGLIQSYTPTDVDPSTLINMFGMGWDDTDTNVQFMHNGGSGTATKIDTGIARPTTDRTTLYDFEMYCAPNGSEVFFRLTEINTGTVFASSATTNLGANTTAVSPHGYISVGGTSSVIGFAHCALHIETV